MAKEFAQRVSKRDRKKRELPQSIDQGIFKLRDDMLLRGAQLQNVKLDKIHVRDQVRTKFNDASIKELAENIKENGLIQPLVIHREGNKFILICGERRFRAMKTVEQEEAPCFILEDKTKEELMAIQFSENSAREELHYIDQADSIYGYKKLTGASERKIQVALGISKSEVHRCLLIGKLDKKVKEAAKLFNTEKYVLLEWDNLAETKAKKKIKEEILSGQITKRTHLKKSIKNYDATLKRTRVKARESKSSTALDEKEIMAALKAGKKLQLDEKTKAALREMLS